MEKFSIFGFNTNPQPLLKKILIIADISQFEKEISSKNRLQFLLFLNNKPNITVTGPGMDNFKPNLTQEELINHIYKDDPENKPNIVIFYILTILFKKFRTFPITSFCSNYINIAFVEDIYHSTKYNLIIKNQFNGILLNIKHNIYGTLFKSVNKNIYYYNHYINTNIYKNYNLPKIYDIIIYGNIMNRFYPFRFRLYHLLKQNQHKFNIKFVEFPSMNNPNINPVINIELAQLINQSYICICTTSKFNMLLKKYIETACCDSMICGNIPTDYNHIFTNNIIEIKPTFTNTQIIQILTNELKNKSSLKNKSVEFGNTVRGLYNFEKGYSDLMDINFVQ